jgi:hypothetical protein
VARRSALYSKHSIKSKRSISSLDCLNGQSVAQARKSRRLFHRCLSWQTEKNSQHYQLLRADLTAPCRKRRGDSLRKQFQELKRRVYRHYAINLDNFIVETSEGNGVLHLICAVEAKKRAWIDQRWLSGEWKKINDAKVVWIKRARQRRRDRLRIASYFANQGQRGSAVIRFSYSWWKTRLPLGTAWQFMLRKYRKLQRDYAIGFGYLLNAWNDLLTTGRCALARESLCVVNRRIFSMAA